MCVFRKAPLIRCVNLNKDEAIESYRGFDVNYGGRFISPYRGDVWHAIEAYTICCGADDGFSPGFHSLRDKDRLTEHDGSLITRVKIWGKVFEYGEFFVGVDAFDSSHGYLSEYLQIIEVVGVKTGIWNTPEYLRSCLREVQVQYARTELTFSQELEDEYEFLDHSI